MIEKRREALKNPKSVVDLERKLALKSSQLEQANPNVKAMRDEIFYLKYVNQAVEGNFIPLLLGQKLINSTSLR